MKFLPRWRKPEGESPSDPFSIHHNWASPYAGSRPATFDVVLGHTDPWNPSPGSSWMDTGVRGSKDPCRADRTMMDTSVLPWGRNFAEAWREEGIWAFLGYVHPVNSMETVVV